MPSFLKSHHSLLYHFVKPYRLGFIGASFFSLALSLCTTLLAVLVGPALRLLLDMDFSKTVSMTELFGERLGPWFLPLFKQNEISVNILMLQVPSLLLGIGFLKLILGTAQYFLWEKTSEEMTRDLRQYLLDSYLSLHPCLRREKKHIEREASLSSLITSDVKMTREYFVHFYGGLPREMLHIFFLGQTLIFLSPKLFMIFLFGVLPAISLIQHLGRKLKKRAKLALQDYSDLTEWLQQRLLGVETIKHFETESLEIEKMKQHSDHLLKNFLRAARVKARSGPLLEFLGVLAMSLVLFVAFHDIQSGVLQASVAISFFTGLGIVAQSGNVVGRYLNRNREGAAALERIRLYLLDLEDSKQSLDYEGSPHTSKEILLSMKEVEARYPDSMNTALHSFSYEFERGKIYCIKGHSGSGKSTLFNIILGNLVPYSGKISFNEHVIKEGIGYLPQNIQLFKGSLQDNIIYPHKKADPDKLESSIKSVQLWDLFQTQKEGLETLISGDAELSGGQTQRVHLARLLYHKYSLILIDEGTSALDPVNEALIYALLSTKSKEGSTILMISHRPTPLQFADKTLYLVNGKLKDHDPS